MSFTDYIQCPLDQGGLGMLRQDVEKLLEVKTELERRFSGDGKLEAHRKAIRRALGQDVDAATKHGGDRTRQESGTLLPNPRDAVSILARLKRDDPQLADAVIRGEITPNKAARPKRLARPPHRTTQPENRCHKNPGTLHHGTNQPTHQHTHNRGVNDMAGLKWIRLDTCIFENPKFLYLIEDRQYKCITVHIAAMCYSGRHGLDGFIPKSALKSSERPV